MTIINPMELLSLRIIIQLILILLAARLVGSLFRRMGQPQVCGEIAAGMLLGPSCLGALAPHLESLVFNSATVAYLNVLSHVGLIFVMFLIGLEFDFTHLRSSQRLTFFIAAAGIVVPFALGLFVGPWVWKEMELRVSLKGFVLFLATALTITAMPVLGRIMIEFNITRTRLGALTMSAAAISDVVGWLLLALVSAVVTAQLNLLRIGMAALGTLAYLLVMLLVVRPLVIRWTQRVMRNQGRELSWNALTQLIIFLLASAAITNLIGIFSLFGAFVMGAILYDQADLRAAINSRMRDFVSIFFLPIFFTCTGLRTDIAAGGASVWLVCCVVVATASAGKIGACATVAKLSGFSWQEAGAIGAMMNTRGLMELIVLNAGYDLGIVPQSSFFVLTVMALVTNFMTAPALRYLMQKREQEQLETALARSAVT
ncbi:MAG TPA: cation:proton antiporter [Candidatus Angelobacter sp.]|nr:cation:proton antiporter [Candidatus Angelobacter sp.]